MPHPCVPGISLRAACKIVGIVQIVVSLLQAIIYTLGLIVLDKHKGSSMEITEKFKNTFLLPFVTDTKNFNLTMIIILSLALLGAVLYGAVGVLLIIACRMKDIKLLKIWSILEALMILSLLVYIGLTLVLGSYSWLYTSLDSLSVLVQFYFLWIVISFIKQLRDDQTLTLTPSIRKNGERIDLTFPMDVVYKS